MPFSCTKNHNRLEKWAYTCPRIPLTIFETPILMKKAISNLSTRVYSFSSSSSSFLNKDFLFRDSGNLPIYGTTLQKYRKRQLASKSQPYFHITALMSLKIDLFYVFEELVSSSMDTGFLPLPKVSQPNLNLILTFWPKSTLLNFRKAKKNINILIVYI